MNIKEQIFAYYRRKQPARQAVFPKYEDVRSILILFESDLLERNGVVKSIRDELLTQDKDIVLWGYCDKKDVTTPILPQSRIIGRRDFNILGAPKKELIADLQKRPYDLLMDLSQQPCLPIRYLNMYARATFRAGLNISTDNDLCIDMPPQESPHALYTQIVKYLKMIRTK